MGADEDVHLPHFHLFQGLLLLLGGAEAADDIHLGSKVGKAGGESLVMLLGQHRSGHQHCHLLAVHGGLVSRPDSHLRLAKAHIPAKQAVHGLFLFHILLDFLDGLQLILCLLIGESLLKLVLGGIVGRKSCALGLPALGVDFDELLGNILHGLLGPGLGLGPLGAAHAMEPGHLPLGADILLQKVHLLSGHKELVIPAVFDVKIVLVHAPYLKGFHPQVFADAMVHMHHIVPGLDIPEMGQLSPFGCAFYPLPLLMAEDILLRHHHQLGRRHLKAGGQGTYLDIHQALFQHLTLFDDQRGNALPRKELPDAVGLVPGVQENQHPLLLPQPAAGLAFQKIHLPMEGCHIGGSDADGVFRLRPQHLLQHQGRVNDPVAPGTFDEVFPAEDGVLDLRIFLHHGADLLTDAGGFVKDNCPPAPQVAEERLRLAIAVSLQQGQHRDFRQPCRLV